MEDILVYFSYIHDGNWEKIYSSIERKEQVDLDEVKRVVDGIKCKYITLLSSYYPDSLKKIYKPPFVLFYEGDINLLKSNTIAVVGSRENSDYGQKMCEDIVAELIEKKDIVIVSGLAKGIDSIAHQRAIDSNGRTIGVLGCGLDYPLESLNKTLYDRIKTEGLIISEYPPMSMPSKAKFPLRNRILAGISSSILVVEAKKKSGSMITVSCALDQGKDIFCVPDRADKSSGCNFLIKQGATLVETGEDVLNGVDNYVM